MAGIDPTLNLRSKLPATGTSIFSVMSALAQQHDAVNLGQGFPDYTIDPLLSTSWGKRCVRVTTNIH